ncbi:MAG: hypothetical protein ACFFAO_21715 [Candidatus Hermodarchaeota archaeon]
MEFNKPIEKEIDNYVISVVRKVKIVDLTESILIAATIRRFLGL